MHNSALLFAITLALLVSGLRAQDAPLTEEVALPALGSAVVSESDVLLRLRRAFSNFNSTVAVLPDYQGWEVDSPPPCKRRDNWWTGVSCNEGEVSKMYVFLQICWEIRVCNASHSLLYFFNTAETCRHWAWRAISPQSCSYYHD